MTMYYDRLGEPIEADVWARRFEDLQYKRVLFTRLWWGARVSTIWLGLDHSFGGDPPLIFETMVFAPRLGRRFGPDLDQRRYETEDAARTGHALAVRAFRWKPWRLWG